MTTLLIASCGGGTESAEAEKTEPASCLSSLSLDGQTAGCPAETDEGCPAEFEISSTDLPTEGEGVYITRDDPFVEGEYELTDNDCGDVAKTGSVVLSNNSTFATVFTDQGNLFGQWNETATSFLLEGTPCAFTFYKDTIDCEKFGVYLCILSESEFCLAIYEWVGPLE